MNLNIKELPKIEKEELADWLSSDTWPTFVGDNSSKEAILKRIEEGAFFGDHEKNFWVISESGEKLGLLELYELTEHSPMFSIRIKTKERGKGIGRFSLHWLCSYFFKNYPQKTRLEAQTREDNQAMRKLLEEHFFVLEAYYRKAWPVKDSEDLASVGYGLLKEDWINRKKTHIDWNN